MGRASFVLGNHTYAHLNANQVSAADYVADIERDDAALRRLAGAGYRRLFRYAYLAFRIVYSNA